MWFKRSSQSALRHTEFISPTRTREAREYTRKAITNPAEKFTRRAEVHGYTDEARENRRSAHEYRKGSGGQQKLTDTQTKLSNTEEASDYRTTLTKTEKKPS